MLDLGAIRENGMHFTLVADGRLNESYPTLYGTHLRFGSYYAFHLLIDNTGSQMWVSGTDEAVIYPTTWHEVTLKT